MIDSSSPCIGDAAPDFLAATTEGEIRLSSWMEGRWVALMIQPAAFTPVSVSEMRALSDRAADFEKAEAAILVATPDTRQALLAWRRDLAERFKVKVGMPLVSDTQLRIARLYGAVHANASSSAPVRATILIDPKRTVRFVAYYPLANGRSMDEVLRLLQALRASDREHAPTPADWKPGEALLEAPPTTASEVKEGNKAEGEDFYYRTKPAGA